MSSFLSGRWSFGAKKTSNADSESQREESLRSDSRLPSRGQSYVDKRLTTASIDEVSKYRAVRWLSPFKLTWKD
jgi:hypothetical protein